MAEQIIIEFIADASQLIPTVEILEKAGVVTKDELETFTKLGVQGSKALDTITASGKKLVPTLSDIDEKAVLLSDTFKDTFQKQVQDAFAKSGTSLQDFIKKLSGVSNPTPLNNLKLQLANVLSQITGMATKLDTLKLTPGASDTTEFKQLENEYTALFKTAGDLTTQIEKLGSAEQTAGSGQASFRSQIRQSTEALAQQLATGELSIAQVYEQAKGAGVLKDAYGDAARAIQVLSSDTFALDATLQGVQAVAAGFQLAQGAEALFGSDNKDLQEVLVKLNAIMAITTGLQQLSILLRKEEAVSLAAQVIQQKIGNAQQLVENGLQSESVVVRLAAAAAQKVLNAAMEANPLGLLVAGIATLVGLFASYKLTLGQTTDEEKRQAAATAALNEAHQKAAQTIADEVGSLEILVQKAGDLSLSYQERQDAIDKIRTSYPEYLHNLSLENIYTAQSTQAIAKEIEMLKQRALVQASEDVYKEKLKAVIDAQNEYNRTVNEGATFWEKFTSFVKGYAGINLTAQQGAENEKLGELKTALNDANGAWSTYINNVEQGSDAAILAINNYINRFNAIPTSFPTFHPVSSMYSPQQAEDDKNLALATAQYQVDIAKKGTAEEFAARKAQASLEYKYEYDAANGNLDKQQVAYKKYLTAKHQIDLDALAASQALEDEQFQITERHLQQTADLFKGIADNDKQSYDLRLAALQQFINSSLILLNKQEQAELSNSNLTNAERLNIIDKYNVESQKVISDGYKQRNDLIAGYNKQLKDQDAADFQSVLNDQQKSLQTVSDNIDKAFAQIGRNNIKDKNDRLAQLENDYNNGVITATQLAQKLNDLDDEFDKSSLGNQKAYLEAKLSNLKSNLQQNKISQEDYNTQSEKLQSELNDVTDQLLHKNVDNLKDSEEQKLEILKNSIEEQEKLFQASLQFIQQGIEALGNNFTSAVSSAILNVVSTMKSSADELKIKITEIANDPKLSAADKQFKTAQAEADATSEKINAAFLAGQTIINAAFQQSSEARKAQVDAEISKLEDQKNAELANTELTESQKAAITKKYDAQEAAIKNKAAKQQRQADIAQAIVNGLLAAGNALATVKPFIPNALIAAALAVTLTGVQIASIKSAPLPQFKKGTRHAPAGYAIVGEEGPEIIKLTGGEKIYTNTESKTIENNWEREVIRSPYDVVASMIQQPVGKQIIERTSTIKSDPVEIDYDKLGKHVAKHMKEVVDDMPQTGFEWTEEGVQEWIRKGKQKDIILNKKGRIRKK